MEQHFLLAQIKSLPRHACRRQQIPSNRAHVLKGCQGWRIVTMEASHTVETAPTVQHAAEPTRTHAAQNSKATSEALRERKSHKVQSSITTSYSCFFFICCETRNDDEDGLCRPFAHSFPWRFRIGMLQFTHNGDQRKFPRRPMVSPTQPVKGRENRDTKNTSNTHQTM